MNEIPVYEVGKEVTFIMYGVEYRGVIEEHHNHSVFGDTYTIATPTETAIVLGWEILPE